MKAHAQWNFNIAAASNKYSLLYGGAYMKRIISFLITLIVLCSILSGCSKTGTKPLTELKVDDVVSADITLMPPNTTITISDPANLEQLVALLNDIILFEQDDAGRQAEGQLVTVTVTRADGSTASVGAYGSYIFYNDICYRAEYEPSEALNGFGNSFLTELPDKGTPPETEESLSTSNNDVPEPSSYYFEAQYIRTNGYVDGASYPVVTLIESKEELDAYYEANRDRYDLERHDAVYSDQTIGFLDACDRYDKEYFDEERNLVLILLEEPSGSNRHEITDVRRNDKGEWVITIDRILPECGTDDMAEWHLFLEIQMGNVISRDDTIIVNLKNTGSTSAVMDENYPIKITSGESSIYPYPHFKYSEDWTGEGFLCADGVPVGMTLSEFLAEDLLPAVPYSDDFAVTYAENVTFRSINLYNTAFELLGNLFDFADLSTLEAGEYYLGIVVNEQGAYIEEAKQYECTGWECLFRLIVK